MSLKWSTLLYHGSVLQVMNVLPTGENLISGNQVHKLLNCTCQVRINVFVSNRSCDPKVDSIKVNP